MSLFKTIVFIGVVAVSYNLWSNRQLEEASTHDNYGFVPILMPTNISGNAIIIFAPENCTSEEAAQAEELSEQLAELGIPHVMEDHYEATHTDFTEAEARNTNNVMRGKIPIVLFNGYGQSNPSLEDVVAIYSSFVNTE